MADADAQCSTAMVMNVASGVVVELLSLWRDRRILLVFLRHLGCAFCRVHMDEITSIKGQLDKCDLDIVFVSLGTRESSRAFIEVYGNPPGEFYVSTDAVKGDINGAAGAYAMMRLVRDATKVVTARGKEILAASKREHLPHLGGSQEAFPGDIAQLGGVFILGPGNFCEYSFRSAFGGDTPDLGELLKYAQLSQKPAGDGSAPSLDGADSSSGSSGNGGSSSSSSSSSSEQFAHPMSQAWVDKLTMTAQAVALENAASGPSRPRTTHEHAHDDVLIALLSIVGLGAFRWLVRARQWPAIPATCALVAIAAVPVGLVLRHRAAVAAAPEQKPGRAVDISSTLLNRAAVVPQPKRNAVELRLYTPPEIDQLIMEAGTIACDCPRVMMDIPLTGKVGVDLPPALDGLRSPSHAGNSPSLNNDELLAAAQTLCFLREFLAKPHPLLGRRGPVCPFMPTSLRKNYVYLAVVRTGPDVQAIDVAAIVEPFAERFGTLEPTAGALTSYKAVLLVFPDIPLARAPALIDGVQATLKPLFVRRCLMIGEFHQNNNATSLSNAEFYPLRTPVPTIAIRHMVTGDIAFLDMTKYAPDVRVAFLGSYIQRFEGDASPKTVEIVARARKEVSRAETELASAAAAARVS